jgi:cytoplasmic iron level regulating protein YaaA (DUF328/UPF0246 family)
MRSLLGRWSAALKKIYLIGCGKSKRSEATEAWNLYTGNLYGAARRYVMAERETRAGDGDWWILSAAHGLLDPVAVVEPYDETLTRGGKEKREKWSVKVVRQLNYWYGQGLARVTVVLLAGDAYASELVPKLESLGVTVEQPLEGLQLGQRLSWFKKNTRGG